MTQKNDTWDDTLAGVSRWCDPFVLVRSVVQCHRSSVSRYYRDGSTNVKGVTWRLRSGSAGSNSGSPSFKPKWLQEPELLLKLYLKAREALEVGEAKEKRLIDQLVEHTRETYPEHTVYKYDAEDGKGSYVEVHPREPARVSFVSGTIKDRSPLAELAQVADAAAVAALVARHERNWVLRRRCFKVKTVLVDVARWHIRRKKAEPTGGVVYVYLGDQVMLFAPLPLTRPRRDPLRLLGIWPVKDEDEYLTKIDLA